MSRFFIVLMEEQDGLQTLFRRRVDQPASALPTLGEKLAVDAKAVPSLVFRTGSPGCCGLEARGPKPHSDTCRRSCGLGGGKPRPYTLLKSEG